MVSVGPPAEKGTTKVISDSGYAAGSASPPHAAMDRTATLAIEMRGIRECMLGSFDGSHLIRCMYLPP